MRACARKRPVTFFADAHTFAAVLPSLVGTFLRQYVHTHTHSHTRLRWCVHFSSGRVGVVVRAVELSTDWCREHGGGCGGETTARDALGKRRLHTRGSGVCG